MSAKYDFCVYQWTACMQSDAATSCCVCQPDACVHHMLGGVEIATADFAAVLLQVLCLSIAS